MIPYRTVAVIGGAGYVGSAIVPRLLGLGLQVKVVDLFLYDESLFRDLAANPRLSIVRADIREANVLDRELRGQEAVIHLACISNDPSFELDPALGKSINYDAFFGLLKAARDNRVRRFLYASSSSVYGVRSEPDVTEDTPCAPLTDYSKFKLLCEEVLHREAGPDLEYAIVRPATVCGYAPRLRLDVIVNILTMHALANRRITVFGGHQLRPNIHIDDMVDAYVALLEAPREKVHRRVFNAGFENRSVNDLADLVRTVVADPRIEIVRKPTDDPRSYHINSDRIRNVLGFAPRRTIADAVRSLCDAYRAGRIPDAMTSPAYHNVKVLKNGCKALSAAV